MLNFKNKFKNYNSEMMEYNTKYLDKAQVFLKRYWKYYGMTEDIMQNVLVQFLGSYRDDAGSGVESYLNLIIKSNVFAERQLLQNKKEGISLEKKIEDHEVPQGILINDKEYDSNIKIPKSVLSLFKRVLGRQEYEYLTFFLQDLTFKEIAVEMDINIKHCYTLQRSCMDKLSKLDDSDKEKIKHIFGIE